MGFYDLYRTRMQCSLSDKEIAEQDMTTQIQDDFYSHPNYYSIYKNGISNVLYDVVIQEGDAKDRNVGYKSLLSYPYNTFMFNSGDYIHWTYGGSSTVWLAYTFDKQYLYASKGRIYKCNNYLKWIDDHGAIQSFPCVIDYELTNTSPDESRNIFLANGTIKVTAQLNEYTSLISLNRRFLFGKNDVYSAYKLESIQNMIDENLVVYTMTYDVLSANDNVSLGIADYEQNNYELVINQDNFQQSVSYSSTLTATLKLNGEVVSETLEWLSSNTSIATINSSTGVFTLLAVGSVTFTCRMVNNTSISDTITVVVATSPASTKDNRILPYVTELLQNSEVIYTVYSYTKNVVNANTFTITASGVPLGYYSLTLLSGNSFKVKNLARYDDANLVITCVNNTDATVETISIKLKGLY